MNIERNQSSSSSAFPLVRDKNMANFPESHFPIILLFQPQYSRLFIWNYTTRDNRILELDSFSIFFFLKSRKTHRFFWNMQFLVNYCHSSWALLSCILHYAALVHCGKLMEKRNSLDRSYNYQTSSIMRIVAVLSLYGIDAVCIFHNLQ